MKYLLLATVAAFTVPSSAHAKNEPLPGSPVADVKPAEAKSGQPARSALIRRRR
jgi:hypothetical protein